MKKKIEVKNRLFKIILIAGIVLFVVVNLRMCSKNLVI